MKVLTAAAVLHEQAAFVVFVQHLWHARKQQWTKRRLRLTWTYFALLCVQARHLTRYLMCFCPLSRRFSFETHMSVADTQGLNVFWWLAPNAALLSPYCYFYHPFVDTAGFLRWCVQDSSFTASATRLRTLHCLS